MADEMVSGYSLTLQRERLSALVHRISDDELEDAIALLEWLTDPERRYLVEQLAGWSHHAQRIAQESQPV